MIDVMIAARKWRGKHVVNTAYRNLLASLVYPIWQESNRRKFQQLNRDPSALAIIILDKIRLRTLSAELPNKISTVALCRLWQIPWHTTSVIRLYIIIFLMQFIFTEKRYNSIRAYYENVPQ